MPTYSQIPIRCRLSIVSNPPAYPIDDNTGMAPKFWRGQDIAIDVGIFDADNVGVDLSNVATLQLTFRESPTSPTYLVTTTVSAGSIIPVVSYSGWSAGTAQQATFYLSPAETDLSLAGQDSAQIWMDIRGYLDNGNYVVYGAGYVTVYNPGGSVAPIPTSQVVSYHASTNSAGDTTISPTRQIHTEVITVTGFARTSNFILEEDSPFTGARTNILFLLPATPGITLNIYNDSLSGTLLATFTTDANESNISIEFVYNGTAWAVLNAIIPAF
jgi:hypothetical protein